MNSESVQQGAIECQTRSIQSFAVEGEMRSDGRDLASAGSAAVLRMSVRVRMYVRAQSRTHKQFLLFLIRYEGCFIPYPPRAAGPEIGSVDSATVPCSRPAVSCRAQTGLDLPIHPLAHRSNIR